MHLIAPFCLLGLLEDLCFDGVMLELLTNQGTAERLFITFWVQLTGSNIQLRHWSEFKELVKSEKTKKSTSAD